MLARAHAHEPLAFCEMGSVACARGTQTRRCVSQVRVAGGSSASGAAGAAGGSGGEEGGAGAGATAGGAHGDSRRRAPMVGQNKSAEMH